VLRTSTIFLISSLILLGSFFGIAYAQEEIADDIMDQLTGGIQEGIKSINVPNDNIIDTDQEEIDNLAKSSSEWLESFFDFGKKTHAVTQDAMAVAAPSWVDPLIIAIVAGAVVFFVMIRVAKKIGVHIAIAFGALAMVLVFLMLLDLNS